MKNKNTIAIISFITIIVIVTAHIIQVNYDMCDINPYILNKLRYESIEDSYIYKLGNYCNIKYQDIDYKVTDEDISKKINDIIASYDELTPIIKSSIDEHNIILMSIKVKNGTEFIYAEDKEIVHLKDFKYDKILKDYITSSTLNEAIEFEWAVPNEEIYGQIKGENVYVYICVKEIYEYKHYEWNDEFVKDKLGYKNTKEYVSYLKKELKAINNERAYIQESYNILNQVVMKSYFCLNEDEILNYAIHFVEQYEDIAQINNMSFSDYGKTFLGLSEDEFYNYCYEEAEKEIKQYLVIGAIAEKSKITITDKMLKDYCAECDIDINLLEDRDKNEIRCQILTDKVFELIRKDENAYEKN